MNLKDPTPATLRHYSLTLEQFRELCGTRCPLCNKRYTVNRPPVIDHDHATLKVRGTLCRQCNNKLVEDPDWYEAAAKYLRYPTALDVWGVQPSMIKQEAQK